MFWELDSIGIKESGDVTDDDKAVQQFLQSVSSKDGRYYVSWPWCESIGDIPSNYGLCIGRLKSTHRRLQDDPVALEQYSKIIETQIETGIIEEVTSTTPTGDVQHYIPHHAVYKPNSATTKVRIVYDGSARASKSDRSINDRMLRGLNILSNLCGILMRFRLFMFAVVSDIEKAFHQIGLYVPDRDLTRFLWLKDPTRSVSRTNIKILRFCRVPFGFRASMFLLTAAIICHLNATATATAEQIKRNFYVDNVFAGGKSTEELCRYYNDSKQILGSASMNLREWCSNNKEFLKKIPEQDRSQGFTHKILGLKWDSEKDLIYVPGSESPKCLDASTKRQVLQAFSKIYDPLGYFSPVILRARLLLQDMSQEKVEWDSPLDPTSQKKWNNIEQVSERSAVFLFHVSCAKERETTMNCIAS